MKLTYYGHACFSVQIGKSNLLFDPFITPNPKAAHIDIKNLAADYILISHGHEDHLADAVAIARRTGATVIAPFEICQWLGGKGVGKTWSMNHGGVCQLPDCQVRLVNAVHSSSLPDGSYGGNPCGFVVESNAGNFYYSGDTALTRDMELVGEWARLTFAALCIGGNFTMGADDAVRAAKMVGCDHVVGVHYDTFPPIQIDHKKTAEKFTAAGLRLHLLQIGGSEEF
jgi:L-ascorbate metabolism protein UlaG (beta-lactamase superfamily)